LAQPFGTRWNETTRALAAGLRNRATGFMVWAGVSVIVLVLWAGLRNHEDRLLERLILVESRQLENSALRAIEARGLEVLRLARRWEGVADPKLADWADDAASVSSRDALFRAFEWRDENLETRWVTPLTAASATGELAPQFEGLRRDAASSALSTEAYHVSSSLVGPDGRRQVMISAPMHERGRVTGVIAGVIRVRDLADTLSIANRLRGFQISIREGEVLVYGPEPAEWSDTWRLFDSAPVRIGGLDWSLDFWPTDERLDRLRSMWPPLTLVLGLLGAIAAGYTAHQLRQK
jgi:sensor domain CHASE-containing protein